MKKRTKNGHGCKLSNLFDMDISHTGSVIHRADYQRLLAEEAVRLGVKLRLGADVQDIDFDNTTVTLRNGEIVAGDIIIGADGGLISYS